MKNNLFETTRLLVRKLTLNDAELFFKYSQEEINKKELPDEVFKNILEAREKIEYLIANYDSKYPLVYGIIMKGKNILIGHLSLSEIGKGIEIGYAIATDYQNNGYASEIFLKNSSGSSFLVISSWLYLKKSSVSLRINFRTSNRVVSNKLLFNC
jgi:ribosomal-protein-alanine N-acetyltransferase